MTRIGPAEPTTATISGRRSIADLLWVANTSHGPGAHWHARPNPGDADHDHLRSPADGVRYLSDHGLALPAGLPTATQLASIAAIRDAVRDLASGRNGESRKRALARLATARFRLTAEGGLVAADDGWDGFVSDLLIPLVELTRGRHRLAACGNPACRLLFVDDSRSHTRRWCDDGGCGNRARTRVYRRTHAAGGGPRGAVPRAPTTSTTNGPTVAPG